MDRQLGEGVLMRNTHKCHLFANPHREELTLLKTATTSFPWQGDYYFYHHVYHQSSSYRYTYGDTKTIQFLNMHGSNFLIEGCMVTQSCEFKKGSSQIQVFLVKDVFKVVSHQIR